MATFSQEISAKYHTLDYDGVIKSYDWIKEIMFSLYDDLTEPDTDISFQLGKISCNCKTIKEFKEHAYGVEIKVYSYTLYFFKKFPLNGKEHFAAININEKQISIYCYNKEVLIDICTALENSLKFQESEPTGKQQINHYTHYDESIHLTVGDNNILQEISIGKNNSIEKDVSALKQNFWQSVLQSLTANFIWYVLGVAAAGLLGYYGINYFSLMK